MMNSINKTLYIPLYGKAYVSKKGCFLCDIKAEEIWEKEAFPLRGKSKSKWLAYYMGIRSAVFDGWLQGKLSQAEDAVILHLGCGMDSRILRVPSDGHKWYDVDFPQGIQERNRYYTESAQYRMIGADIRNPDWFKQIPEKKRAIIVMEGVSMYLTFSELQGLFHALSAHFDDFTLLMDCYTGWAARLSKYKNPIHDVGVAKVYGMDDPASLESASLVFVKEHDMTPPHLIHELHGAERFIFKTLYAGHLSKKLYRLYEYQKA